MVKQLEHGIRTDFGFKSYLPDALASGSHRCTAWDSSGSNPDLATRGCRYAISRENQTAAVATSH
jgi:hypothetical protein